MGSYSFGIPTFVIWSVHIVVGLYFLYLANELNNLKNKENREDMKNHVAVLFSFGVLTVTYHSFLWLKNSVDFNKIIKS
tara:strand:- start:190 stop:426 length:237 start_codon:yes stop_codon:yes gene_type:complete